MEKIWSDLDDFDEERKKQLEELKRLSQYLEDENWNAALCAVGFINPSAYEVEGWRDILRILRWQIEHKQREKALEMIQLLIVELRAEY